MSLRCIKSFYTEVISKTCAVKFPERDPVFVSHVSPPEMWKHCRWMARSAVHCKVATNSRLDSVPAARLSSRSVTVSSLKDNLPNVFFLTDDTIYSTGKATAGGSASRKVCPFTKPTAFCVHTTSDLCKCHKCVISHPSRLLLRFIWSNFSTPDVWFCDIMRKFSTIASSGWTGS